jgi:hypothetical protein
MKEEEEFEFLLQESFERGKPKFEKPDAILPMERNGQRNTVHRIIEEPHLTTEYDVDDLINELNGQESKKKAA